MAHQDRHRGVLERLARGVAEHAFAEAGAAVGTHDEEIGFVGRHRASSSRPASPPQA